MRGLHTARSLIGAYELALGPDFGGRFAAYVAEHTARFGHAPGRACTAACAEPAAEPTAEDCPTCRGARYLRPAVDRDDPRFGKALPCRCITQDPAARTAEILARSELPPQASERFRLDLLPARREPRVSAEHWLATRDPAWLVLSGQPGLAKSHAAIGAAAGAASLGLSVFYTGAVALVDRLRFEATARRHEAEADGAAAPMEAPAVLPQLPTVRRALAVDVLVVEDLGAERYTPFAAEQIYQVLDDRYLRQQPTIITTNERPPGDRTSRVWSRVFSHTALVVEVFGNDYRRRRYQGS